MTWLQRYLAIDTANPLGDALRRVVFLANILEKANILFETAGVAIGFTESPCLNDVDIVNCGFLPFAYLEGETTSLNGNIERIFIEEL